MPIALYIAADDETAAPRHAVHCRRYAELRDWTVVLTATDLVPGPDLTGRTGWDQVVMALSDGSVRGIVTRSRDMLAGTTETWQTLTTLAADRNAFLTTAETPAPSAAARARRRRL
ncbi:hypothetical protein ACGFX4_20115 [Kitasatospora sp. NPDC048365]|uniref:hypothetical protein n=1 Tax=Kitasatospora sp. NPDC048365 TaxID=3364050 RepID=UPI00372223F5